MVSCLIPSYEGFECGSVATQLVAQLSRVVSCLNLTACAMQNAPEDNLVFTNPVEDPPGTDRKPVVATEATTPPFRMHMWILGDRLDGS